MAAIAVNIEEPLFESQTKIKLGSLTTIPDGGISIDKFVGDFVKEQVDNYLHKNPLVSEVMLQKIQDSEKERKAIAGVTKLARERAKKANLHNRKLREIPGLEHLRQVYRFLPDIRRRILPLPALQDFWFFSLRYIIHRLCASPHR